MSSAQPKTEWNSLLHSILLTFHCLLLCFFFYYRSNLPINTVSRARWLPHLPHLKRSFRSIDLLSEGQGLASGLSLPHSNTSICVLAPQPRPYWISFTSSVDQTSRPIGSLYSCSSLTYQGWMKMLLYTDLGSMLCFLLKWLWFGF